jgi:hypothetical protein
MNWRRGLMLVGINLVLAMPLILMMEARDAQWLREHKENLVLLAREAAARDAVLKEKTPARVDAAQEEESVSFNYEGLLVSYPVQVEVVRFGNFPASALTGWRLFCRPKWSLSGIMQGQVMTAPTDADLSLQRRVDIGLCLLIVIQWLLVGGFPLGRPQKRWWREAGIIITACTVVATCLVLIPAVEKVARLPDLLAGVAWLWWFCLLAWTTLRFAWRRAAGWLTRQSN